MNSFSIVRQFEESVAKFAGSRYAVAVNSCTSALSLSLEYVKQKTLHSGGAVVLPAHTFISVPMAVIHAGMRVCFQDIEWRGCYQLYPHPVIDGALRFRKGMYQGGLHCLSFHARKILNIGEGGMILTDEEKAADWLRAASYCGRKAPDYSVENIEMIGWNVYMHPEKAARGLHLMEYIQDEPDQVVNYPDLRKVKAWKNTNICRVQIGAGPILSGSTSSLSSSEMKSTLESIAA